MNDKTRTPGQAAEPAAARKPMAEPAGGWPQDNYSGRFGHFKRDPFTGIREPADEATRKAMEAEGVFNANGAIEPPAPAAAT